MLDMADKKKNRPARPAKESEPMRERMGVNLNVWLPAELMAAFEAMRSETRRTKTAEVVLIFEDYLKARGFWPPTKPTP